jgi:hypothetical protein
MKTIPDDLYKKILKISERVRGELRSKGLIVPVENDDGSIGIGPYSIAKDANGHYNILDHWNDVVVKGINLPQTAIIVANKMALTYNRDDKLLDIDRKYGYADFEETLYKRNMYTTNYDRFDVYVSKYNQARHKREEYKNTITHSFQKLVNLV